MPLKNSTIQSFKQNLIDAKRAETLKRVQYEKRRESENIGILFPESNRLKDPPVKTIISSSSFSTSANSFTETCSCRIK